MHYNTYYTELSGEARHDKAILDTIEYLGEGKFDELTTMFARLGSIGKDQFSFLCSLGGVNGFPVTAWRNHVRIIQETIT